jgi:hypothetical protein
MFESGILNPQYLALNPQNPDTLQEAFVKIREQAKAYLDMKGELRTGMNTINTTNLEYFPVQHKAEIFRLKGEFLMRMGDGDNANQVGSFSNSAVCSVQPVLSTDQVRMPGYDQVAELFVEHKVQEFPPQGRVTCEDERWIQS